MRFSRRQVGEGGIVRVLLGRHGRLVGRVKIFLGTSREASRLLLQVLVGVHSGGLSSSSLHEDGLGVPGLLKDLDDVLRGRVVDEKSLGSVFYGHPLLLDEVDKVLTVFQVDLHVGTLERVVRARVVGLELKRARLSFLSKYVHLITFKVISLLSFEFSLLIPE